MKAIILTYAPVTDREKSLINKSNLLKIAVNHAPYKADYRVIRDCFYDSYKNYSDKLIFLDGYIIKQTDTPNDNNGLYFMGGSITTAIDFTIQQGATDIILIANNTVNGEDFQQCINKGIIELKKYANLYKYTEDGNFDLPFKSIKEFMIG